MTQPNRRMNWLLSRAYRRMLARLDAGLADLGLTGTQSGALFCFDSDDGLLIGELGAKLELGQSAASGLVQRLVAAGGGAGPPGSPARAAAPRAAPPPR